MGTLYLWVLPGRAAPAGFVPTGVVNVWPDTGRPRAELWTASPGGDVSACGGQGALDDVAPGLPAPSPLSATEREITTTGEKRT